MEKPKVLYIDDEPINLELFRMMFRSGLQVFIASTPQKAQELLHDNPEIQVLISDLNMPDINGYQLIEQLHSQFHTLPAFILSGHHPEDAINQHPYKEKITGYFQKPLDKNHILTEINKALGNIP